MTSSSRRQFLHKVATSSLLASFPLRSFAQGSEVFTVAGNGIAGYEAEGPSGVVATETMVNNPYGIVPGPDNALYFCEVDSGRIRRIDLRNLRLSTVAGNGEKGYMSESRRPLETAFSAPHEIRWDQQGNLYVVERDAHAVRRIAGQTGLVTTLAGKVWTIGTKALVTRISNSRSTDAPAWSIAATTMWRMGPLSS